MKKILSIVLFFSCMGLLAQTGKITLHGKTKYKKSIVADVNMEIYQDNVLYKETKTYRNGSFKIDLPLGHVYSVTFKKEDYIEKSVAVITKSDSTIRGRYFFQLDIVLFKDGEDEEDESMLPPVAKLYIKNKNEGFKYDKKYVRWVAEEYEEEIED